MTRRRTVPKLGTTSHRLRSVLGHALDLPTLRDLARDAKVSYHAIRQYRKGQRTPPPGVLTRLAGALRRLGVRMQGDALHLANVAEITQRGAELERQVKIAQRRRRRRGTR